MIDILNRLLRGGSWVVSPWDCRSAFRYNHYSGNRYASIGFRVCRLPAKQ
jgi:formylglycine-generating enzyme required for sulfatase activity